MDAIETQKQRATEADKLVLRLKCRHVTPTSLAQCQLPIKIALEVFAILANRADQGLADCFMALLLLEQDPTRRLQHLQSSRPTGRSPRTAQNFRSFVRNIVGGIYDSGHYKLANTLVHYLIGQPDSLDEHLELHESSSNLAVPVPPSRIDHDIAPEPQNVVSPTKELIWVDRYGLPVDASFNGHKHKSDKEEAEAKKTLLEHLFGNPIVRWNAEDHAAGLYGDPADLDVSGSNTGWVVQRRPAPRAYQQQSATNNERSQQRINQYFRQTHASNHAHASRRNPQTHPNSALPYRTTTIRQRPPPTSIYGVCPNAFDLEFARMDEMDAADAHAQAQVRSETATTTATPALPIPQGDDSWSAGIDDFIAQLTRAPPQNSHRRPPDPS